MTAEARRRLGTFLGVYTPTLLTILGVILFLRTGWVVGNAGWLGTTAIVVLSNAITLITALSLSSLATNMRVGVGGAYYLISRSLGLEMGGALGLPLYVSQALSVTLYAFGLAETVRIAWPGAPVALLAALVVVGVVALAARSTEFALRAQLPVMAFIALSLSLLVLGAGLGPSRAPALGPWADGGFWTVFAVFFPAVTGVLAGVGLSGDLRDPGRSIPRGVVLAVLTGFAVYLVVPALLGHAASPAELRAVPLAWVRIAPAGWLVFPGMWGAILSSAVGSILGAPRTLQALAEDRLVPGVLGRTSGPTGEPRLAMWVTGGIALAAVALGDLNAVARVATMFFLTTYGVLNLAAGLEGLVKDPSFRPRVRTPWAISMLGALGCFVAMFAISPSALLVAVFVEGGIWWGLRRRALRAAWGDVRTGIWLALARLSLMRIRDARLDPRNWRPQVLVFARDVARAGEVVALAAHLGQDRGIVTATTLIEGDPRDRHDDAVALAERHRRFVEEAGLPVFCEVVTVPDLDAGFAVVAQANGFGSLAANLVLFGWPEGEGEVAGLARLLRDVRYLAGLEKSAGIVRLPARPAGRRRIDVWWKGREHNGDLMLLLAHLLSLSPDWRGARIALHTAVDDEDAARAMRASCAAMLEDVRIDAAVHVHVRPPGTPVGALLRERSRGADLVFVGLALPAPGEEEAHARRLAGIVAGLPAVVAVRNAGPFRGRLV